MAKWLNCQMVRKRSTNNLTIQQFNNFSSQRGQTLVEVLAGLGMILIVVTALIGMGVVALKASTSARNRTVAAKLASEEMELVRGFRDSEGFSDLSAEVVNCGTNCYVSGSSVIAGTETVQTNFTRYFTLSTVVAGKIKVIATVEWPESSGTKTTSVTSYLTDWR